MRISVVVTTYNRPDALRAVLEGYAEQTDLDFELIVGDDGSAGDTVALVQAFASRAPFKTTHVWQEDRGFRAAAVRNQAIARARGDYILFTDGDCVPPLTFVANHRALAEAGWFVAGNRILLSERFTRTVLERRLPVHRWRAQRWMLAWMQGRINRFLPVLSLPRAARFRKAYPHRWQGVQSCNLAAWRSDLLRVNGYDEGYQGWGLEDSDLVIRLQHAGIGRKTARFFAPVFHLWHRENDRSRLPENQRLLDELIGSQRTRARVGLDTYGVQEAPSSA